ncbi:hypothetical protein E1A91_D08G273100v1 [Gossypium mustelinum]|uniref:C3H1-type domain-containing protein n=1 Tax=Gossypium mustelinum TaxID=34275 RepID=A0A5D2U3L7_GOSMU|nr:hypothetical protein E1A91_D08G273100v1 [Gossypium mustelinum]
MTAEWKLLFDAGISMSRIASAVAVAVTEGASLSPLLNQDAMWQMNLRSSETMESGYYPERPGEPDCSYYIRTGLCRFGATCRFSHPPNRKLAIAAARMKGEFPERVGQPECQYYLKTGTCKFGATCKFHHPREQAGIAGRVSLNILGYPFRPNETECAYYLRTGQCKFGSTCKFHHPQPTNMMISLRGSPIYPTVASPTTPGQQSYPGGITNWSRASFIPSPRWQGPSSYAPLILPQGMVSVPGWNAYSGEPLCDFYSRYGICKFGPSCKFNHPMGIFTYNYSISSPSGAPVHHLLGSSSGTSGLNLSSEGLVESGSTKLRLISLSENRQLSSSDDNIDTEG